MRCKKCNEETELAGFATYRNKKGESRRRGVCKGCRGQYAKDNFDKLKEYRKNYNIKNRSKKRERDCQIRLENRMVIDGMKEASTCMDCGNYFPAVAMDFDHVKSKNKSIANMVSQGYKIDLILEEITLCELVCACCHRIRTRDRKQNLSPSPKE